LEILYYFGQTKNILLRSIFYLNNSFLKQKKITTQSSYQYNYNYYW